MKVLLAHKFFHLTGGAEVFFFETGRILEDHGHEVAYFSTIDERNRPSKWSQYFVEPPNYTSGSIISRVSSIGRMVFSLNAKKRFAELLAKFKPDVVHVFAIHVHLTPSILAACKDAGVPVLMSCNDYKHICPNYKLYHHGKLCEDCKGQRFYKPILNKCCKDSTVFSVASSAEAYAHATLGIYKNYVHTYLFASEFMAHKTEEFWGKESFRWKMLRNPFNSKQNQSLLSYDDYILFFGRLTEEKGVDILIKAMSYLPEAKLKIVGNGPQEDHLKNLTNSLNLKNVEFCGPKWGDELYSLLGCCRFVVVPSLWHENFPYVILQSFDYAKAVIGSDRGGIPELVKNGKFGLVYPAEDAAALGGAIQTLWVDQARTVAMGQAGKEYVDSEFSSQRFYQTLMATYKGVVT